MIGRIALVGVVTAAGALTLDARSPQQVFRATADVVTVSVSVRAGSRPVAGLLPADFLLTDNGIAQSIEGISIESLPIDVTLILDASSSVAGKMLDRLKASVRDTAKLLHAPDRLRLVAVQHRVRETFPLRPGGEPPPVDGLIARGATSLYDGLAAAMMQAVQPDRRTVIIAFTDGTDTSSIVSAAATRDVARLADGVVHVVVPVEDYRGDQRPMMAGSSLTQAAISQDKRLGKTGDEAFAGETTLREITTQTGGQVFIIDLKDSISDAFKRAIDDFRTSYLLRYTPRGVTREGWHEIGVKVTKSGRYDIRARRGYVGGGNELSHPR